MSKKINESITPAILPKTYQELEEKLSMVTPCVSWVQVDAVDGIFAPNKTWPYIQDEQGMFSKIVKQEEAMPYWDEVNFEIDLMVADPVFDADRWIAAGALRLVVHIESIKLEAFTTLAKNIKDKGVELVLGIDLKTPLETLDQYVEVVENGVADIDGIQCMGIDKIGFQHQAFNPQVLKNITELKKKYPHVPVSVDGGVSLQNAKALIDAGASRLIVGSAVFNADDSPASELKKFSEALIG